METAGTDRTLDAPLCMTRLIVLLAAWVLPVAAGCSPSNETGSSPTLEIYYVGIGKETFNAVTTENIETVGHKCVVSNALVVSKLLTLLDSASPLGAGRSFANTNVRVKVVEDSKSGKRLLALVENDGVVRRGRSDSLLSSKALADLKTLIEAVYREEGACDA